MKRVLLFLFIWSSANSFADVISLTAGSDALKQYQDRLLVGGRDGSLAIVEFSPVFQVTPIRSSLGVSYVHKTEGQEVFLYSDDGRVEAINLTSKQVVQSYTLPIKNPADAVNVGENVFVTVKGSGDLLKVNRVTGAVDKISLNRFAVVKDVKVEARKMFYHEPRSLLLVQIDRTLKDKPVRSAVAVYDLKAGRFVKSIELRLRFAGERLVGQVPDFEMPFDPVRNRLLVAAKGKAVTGKSMYFAIDLNSLTVTTVQQAFGGEQGPVRLISSDQALVIYHTHTPVRSSHLFGFMLDGAGNLKKQIGKKNILDTFDSLNQIDVNEARTLAVMPQSCLVFCSGGNQLKLIDTVGFVQNAFIPADVLGFAPTWAQFEKSGGGRGPSSVAAVAPLFQDRAILNLTMTAPWKQLKADALVPNAEPRKVEVTLPTGQQIEGLISVRGNTSRRECEFPKFKIKLAAGGKGTMFDGVKNFRLNTHCSEAGGMTHLGRLADERATLRETLAYEIGHTLGLAVEAVRRARIKYVDSDSGEVKEHFALVLEDPDDTAERWGGKKLGKDADKNPYKSNVRKTMGWRALALAYYYEALIGNWDWHLKIYKSSNERTQDFFRNRLWNMKVILRGDGSEVPMPYDFDMASLVNGQPKISGNEQATKFLASEDLLTRYLGYQMLRARVKIPFAHLKAAMEEIVSKRSALYGLVSEPFVDSEGAGLARAQLDAFFKLVDGNVFATPVIRGQMIQSTSLPGSGDVVCMGLREGTPVRVLERKGKFVKVEALGLMCDAPETWIEAKSITAGG